MHTFFRRRKTIGVPSERERNAYGALKEILTRMISNYEQFLRIPNDLIGELKCAKPCLHMCPDLQIPLKNGVFDFCEEFSRKFRQSLDRLKNVNF